MGLYRRKRFVQTPAPDVLPISTPSRASGRGGYKRHASDTAEAPQPVRAGGKTSLDAAQERLPGTAVGVEKGAVTSDGFDACPLVPGSDSGRKHPARFARRWRIAP